MTLLLNVWTHARAFVPCLWYIPMSQQVYTFFVCFIEWSNGIRHLYRIAVSKHKSKLWIISLSHSFSCNHLEFLSEIIIRSFIKCGSSINCVRLNTRCVFTCFKKSILWHRNKLGSMIAQPPLSLSLLPLPMSYIYIHACVRACVCVCYCASVLYERNFPPSGTQ